MSKLEDVIDCKHHIIEWNLSTIEIRYGDENDMERNFDEAIEFTGKCINENCEQKFLKTFLDPVYTTLKNGDIENAYAESIKSEKYIGDYPK